MLAAALLAALTAACPSNLANDLRVQPPGTQLVTVQAVSARSTHATLRLWRRAGKCWVSAGGPWAARVGRNGVKAERREGDGTTPVGTFRIHPTMYGLAPDPGVRFRYVRVRCGDWWNEDSSSPGYNTFERVGCGREPDFAASDGLWRNRRAYVHFAVVEFNMRPVVPGRGSGIFLHAETGGPTNGCVSIGRARLVRVLRWLRPGARPHIAIGTPAQLRRR